MKKRGPERVKSKVFLMEETAVGRGFLARLIAEEADLDVCGEAGSVQEALERIPAARPDVVVVSAVRMNGDGADAVGRLRWRHPALPLLAVSMGDGVFHARRMLQAGAAGYLSMGESARRIVPALRRVLAGGVYAPRRSSKMRHGRVSWKKS